MNYLASPRRAAKRYARASIRQKALLSVDLNDPPLVPPIWQREGTSGVAEIPAVEIAASPIDLDAIEDDDVQLLSSSWTFSQARSQLRTRPVMVLLDEDPDISSRTSVINVDDDVDDHLSRVPLNRFRRYQNLSPNGIVINCDAHVNVEDDHTSKRRKVANRRTEPEIVVPKEPVFSCPICMSSLVDACSTICGHIFCQACIKKAIQSQKKCPTCRRKLTANNFHRVFLPTST